MTVADSIVYLEDLKVESNLSRLDSAQISRKLHLLVDKLLIVADARARGLDTLSDVRRMFHEREREFLQNAYLEQKLASVAADSDSVRSFYDDLGTVVRYGAILTEDSAAAESIRALAAEDPSIVRGWPRQAQLSPSGIILTYNGPRDAQRIRGNVSSILLALGPGEVSPVVGWDSMWHAFVLDTIYTRPPEPFDRMRGDIYDYITAHLREEYKRALEDSLRQGRNLRVDSAAINLLLSHSINPRGDFEPYSEAERNVPAYAFDGGDRSVEWLSLNIKNLPPPAPRDATDREWVTRYARLLGLYDIMAVRAREMGLDTVDRTRRLIAGKKIDNLMDVYHDSVIAPRVEIDEESLQELFESRRDELVVDEHRRFSAVAAVGSAQIGVMDSLLEAGESPLEHPDLLTRVQALLAEGEDVLTRPLRRRSLPAEHAGVVFDLQPGESVVCTLGEDRRIFFRLEEILPERPAELEEVRRDLERELFFQRETAVLDSLVDSLRQEYDFQVNRDFIFDLVEEHRAGSGSAEEG
ncbi:hypothetical protein GF402_03550 [Candidatus Fermentibacteria bacterium]|nr:hypothetical protein [Candidatus Fermentibacteria bacterium]